MTYYGYLRDGMAAVPYTTRLTDIFILRIAGMHVEEARTISFIISTSDQLKNIPYEH
ncbi:MAG: hypothetical protein GX797_02860 [Chloroflexi bacterium]|jgi:hypothetical protein|nr:hypothetical protein [Chloroflexota bacterium]